MAKVILETGDSYIAASPVTIYGSAGAEVVKLFDGVAITVDTSVDRIEFTGATSAYKFKSTATGVQVLSASDVVLANVANGNKLSFSNGSVPVSSTFTPATGVVMTVGGVAVTATPAALVSPSVNTAPSEVSSVPMPTAAPTTAPTTAPTAAPTAAPYTIVANKTGSITEGDTVTFTVTPTAAITTTTTLTYQVSGAIVGAVPAGSAADYSPSTGSITFSAGDTSKTFTITATTDGITEGLEGFKVELLDNGYNVKASTNMVFTDGAASGQTYTLTAGSDIGSGFVGTSGDDVFNAGDIGAAPAWTTGDAIDGAGGTGDVFNIISASAIAKPVSATVSNIETINATSGSTVTLDTTTGFSGLTTLNATDVGGATITAATTTDISVTDSAMSTTTDNNILINGGKNITAVLTAADATTDGDANAEIVVGSTALPVGTVNVTLTGKYVDGGNNTMSNIAITGGSTVSVTTATGLTGVQLLAQTTDATNNTLTQSAVVVTGSAATTAATATQAAAVVEADSASVGKIGVKNGAVTINDVNRASTSSAGTIATVTLNNYGDSTINSGALSVVNLSGTGGTLGITTGALTVPTATTLALNVNGLSYKNAGTNNGITIDSDITTLNITSSTTASTVNNITASGATTVSVAGNALLTMSDNTFAAATTINVTNTAGAVFGATAIGANTMFTGGAGADSIVLASGFTKAITMGDGNDTVTYASKGTGGSVAAGNGSADKIIMTTAQAETSSGVSGGTTFNTNFTGFEVLQLSNALAASNTVDVDGINSASKVILTAGGSHTSTSIISNLASSGTVQTNAASTGFVVNVKGASTNTSDVLTLGLSNTAALAAGTITAANVETININNADAATAADATTGSDAVIDTLTLVATSATSVTVTGNNGLTLTNTGNTAITNFDASGVVANNTAATDFVAATTDTTANLAVTFASVNTTASATVTIKGGAGSDVLTGTIAKDSIVGNAGDDRIYSDNAGTKEIQTITLDATAAAEANTYTIAGVAVSFTSTTTTATNTAALAAAINAKAELAGIASATSTATTVVVTFAVDGNQNAITLSTTTTNADVSIVETTAGTAGTTAVDTIDGGAGNDVIVAGGGADFITTGTGADKVFFLQAQSTYSSMATISDYTYSSGGTSNDTIMLGDVATAIGTTTTVQDLSSQTTLAAALDTAASTNSVSNGLSVFIYGGNEYVYVETTGGTTTYQSGDFIVKLTGTPLAAGATIAGAGFDGV